MSTTDLLKYDKLFQISLSWNDLRPGRIAWESLIAWCYDWKLNTVLSVVLVIYFIYRVAVLFGNIANTYFIVHFFVMQS
jgi:hypothetical protein